MNEAYEKSFPRSINCDGRLVELRLLKEGDQEAVLDFARSLPEEDLQFLRIDITDPAVVDRWIASVAEGVRVTVLAFEGDQLVGYGSLNRRELSWMRHLGEIRVIVAESMRGRGLGRILAHEVFGVAKELGLTKIVAQMARQQAGARKMFHDLGFSAEALLGDWVIDRDGRTRDMLIMSYDMTGLEG
ncbi:MAG: GNAT family N-acetyltransferase [Thermoanaerobaculia bacterium]|nr:GNAT family N-acetyltransferase [Thermoanaerobaculia bacterium]